MDLVLDQKRNEVFHKRRVQLESKSGNFTIKCFPTSIWEASLYKAWTLIVSELSPNKEIIEKSLKNFADACQSSEVVLFEKNTFLLYFAYSTKKEGDDEQRFEKISHIIKKFKLSCMSSNSSFKSMVIETKDYSAYLDEFTNATYILVILPRKNVSIEMLKLNTSLSRKAFEDKLNDKEQ
jgi:Ras-related GTP-binding protein A/B